MGTCKERGKTGEQRSLDYLTAFLSPYTDAQVSRNLTGLALIVLHEVGDLTLAQAWRVVRPDSKSHGPTAEQQASRMIKRYRQRYPTITIAALRESGITKDQHQRFL